MRHLLAGMLIPTAVALAGAVAIVVWIGTGPEGRLEARVPGLDGAPQPEPAKKAIRVVPGEPVRGPGQPSSVSGEWPWFRGPGHDAIGREGVRLARQWPAEGPKRLWTVELGEGYAAAAISRGRVYVLDHVHDPTSDWLRSLGKEDLALLAKALAPLSPGMGRQLDTALRPFFPATDTDVRRALSAAQYDQLKQALAGQLEEDRERLLTALRDDQLDLIDRSADMMRCLSLDDGREIWCNGYRVVVASDHGMSRTIPAVAGPYVISLGPRCHVACWDADTGKSLWLVDLVLDHGATVPRWHAGQCPLVDEKTDRLILAPGGKALLVALDYKTGKVIWQSPNPRGWVMTHSSIMPMEFAGRRMYVYCGKGGVAGVAADTGEILWDTTEWAVDFATCPSPVVIGDGRIFFCGGYGSGSLMLQLTEAGGKVVPKTIFRRTAAEFGCEQQTPVFWQGHLYGLRQSDKRLVCLDLDGRQQWHSGRDRFGSAPLMIADGLLLAMNDEGWLTIAEPSPTQYKTLARARVIENGASSWGPMALAGGRLIVRDFTRMVCLDVSERQLP